MRTLLFSTLLILCSGCDGRESGPADAGPNGDAGADGDSDGDSDGDLGRDSDPDDDTEPPIPDDPDCDPLVPAACAMPWPSNLYLEAAPELPTGFTLAFGETTLPANNRSIHIDPAPYRRFDGYTVGSSILVHFSGLDVNDLPGERSIGRSVEPGSSVVLLEVRDSEIRRVPFWVELDAWADDEEEALLFLRPAEILRHGTRYVVAFGELTDRSGAPIQPSPAFRALRDGEGADHPALAPRVERFEEIFTLLEDQGIERGSLTLAWDFVTASRETALGDMISVRDQAYELVGEQGPELTIEEVRPLTREEDPHIAYEVRGTFRTPRFTEELAIDDVTGYVLHRDESGEPTPNGWVDRGFVAMIPHDNGSGRPLELMEYGHGLLGTYGQVFSGYNRRVAYDHGYIYFGATLTGFGGDDPEIIVNAISEGSRLICFSERLHQGVMEYLVLARAIREQFAELPEIAALEREIDPAALVYSGISQGGIYGATVVALSKDILRGHLGVPGNNYAVLLERSVDFLPYLALVKITYQRRLDQPIVLEAVANLWQTTDPVSYYRAISAEPLPDTPVHHVLLAQAQGDWQVAPVTNETAARSGLGLALMEGYGREVALVEPTPYPHEGSALVNYAFGDPWAPVGNRPPPREGHDPHESPRREPHYNVQMVHFLRTGEVIDVCGGDGCSPE